MPLVSIIVPVHNTGAYVADCLASIECQSLRDIEILCIDDASSDDSLKVCEEFAASDDRFKLVALSENEGASAVRNRGIDMATAEFVLFMDSDDWYPSNETVEHLYRAAVDHGVEIAGGEMCEVDGSTGRKKTDYRGLGHLSLYNFDESGLVDYRDWQGDLGYTRFIYKRDLLVRNGIRFPDLVRYEDPVFFVKAMIAAGRFYALAEPVYCYRVNYKQATMSDRAIRDAIDAHVELLIIARENGLDLLKEWLVESLQWYSAQGVYQSMTYRVGDALAKPYRELRRRIGR